MASVPLFIVIGLVSGFLSGLLGVGGGIIIVPALIGLAGFAPHHAIGISLAVIVPAAITGALKHYSNGHVDLNTALLIAAGAILGGYLGATTAGFVSGALLKKFFAVFLILVGANMLR